MASALILDELYLDLTALAPRLIVIFVIVLRCRPRALDTACSVKAVALLLVGRSVRIMLLDVCHVA
jgi:hypothetical protein